MDSYITGKAIKGFREKRGITQLQLAEQLNVSDKTVSKWETGRGLPDITLLEPLACALGVSLTELFSGSPIDNLNRSANMLKSCIYVCPVCGNIIHTCGEAQINCCGIELIKLEAEPFDEAHTPVIENVEDEIFVSIPHDMTREHYISFIALVNGDRFDMVKLYPEGNAEARFKRRGHGRLYAYCNRHGLMCVRI